MKLSASVGITGDKPIVHTLSYCLQRCPQYKFLRRKVNEDTRSANKWLFFSLNRTTVKNADLFTVVLISRRTCGNDNDHRDGNDTNKTKSELKKCAIEILHASPLYTAKIRDASRQN